MNLNDLTIATDDLDTARLLKNWRWLVTSEVELLLVTKTGDCFLLDAQTGRILFLDTTDGELEQIAADFEQFRSVLGDPEFISDYFSLALLAPVIEEPVPEKAVFALPTPPVLGGSPETDDLSLVDIYDYFDRMGTLWEQLDQIELPEEDMNGESDEADSENGSENGSGKK